MDRPRHPDLAASLFGGKPEHTLALLRAVWPAAVGEELARRTEPVACDAGLLRIRVSDMRWQRTLLRMRGPILGRLRRVAGQVAPRGLSFVTGEVAAPGVRPPRAATAERAVERAAVAPPLVAAAAAVLDDPQTRDRFLATAARYLARFGPPQAGASGGSSGGSGTG